SPTVTSSSPIRTKYASSSRVCVCRGTLIPGARPASRRQYAPPVSKGAFTSEIDLAPHNQTRSAQHRRRGGPPAYRRPAGRIDRAGRVSSDVHSSLLELETSPLLRGSRLG